MEHNQNTIATLMIKRHMDQISWPFLTFSSVAKKLLVAWGHALVAVAFFEKWQLERGLNKKQFMDCPPGQR